MSKLLGFAERHERNVILLFCAITAARVLIFSAGFPFFNNVDEQAHVDLVMKYARGEIPRDLGHYSSESAYYFALYGTPEYFNSAQQFKQNKFPPPIWTLPAEQRQDAVTQASDWWQSNENHESGEPPVYYGIAGVWLNLGHALGLTDGWLLYWVRFLNVFIAVALVWVGFLTAKCVFPEEHFMRLTVPLLLTIWPQSTFYSIQSDSLSPLCFGVAFLGLLKLLVAERPSLVVSIWTGLAMALTCLTKTTNIGLLLVAATALIFKLRHVSERGTLRAFLPAAAALLASALIPIGFWFARNVHTFGDLTATATKIDFLGWTRKPLADWWSHPIFSLDGMNAFWPELVASFWRGELIWNGKRLSSNGADAFYWISSTVAIAVAVVSLFSRSSKLTSFQRESLWLAFSSFAVLVLFLAFLSVAFDFGSCVYPSREHPYFTSGRLLTAAAVPFFLLYAHALDYLGSLIPRQYVRELLIASTAIFVLGAEVTVNWPVVLSPYNLLHLPSPV
jgi:predicted membrane protein DUF2142